MSSRALVLLASLLTVPASAQRSPSSWADVDAVLDNAVSSLVFPCASAAVIDSKGALVYAHAVGSFVYGDSPPPPNNGGSNPRANFSSTLFDMASLTKIVGPTTVAALLFESGDLDLDAPVASPTLLGPAFSRCTRESAAGA